MFNCSKVKLIPVARSAALTTLLIILPLAATAQQGYQKPSQDVLDILSAAVTPTASVSPARDTMLLATGLRYPPIADLAQPMLRLAGLRINPNTNGPHRYQYAVALALKRISDGSEIKIDLPPGAKIGAPQWSADGKQFAFTNITNSGIELWVGDSSSGKVRKLKAIAINAAEGDPFQWMPDNQTLLVQLVIAKRRPAPAPSSVPREPNWQESSGKVGPVRTFQDLLKTPYDEDLFEYY
ncbi:MAG: S9 family peptidase, partial [Acidobacteriota bacterium]|nr:S9 family peptidase [Acidobacteriota bacterium]